MKLRLSTHFSRKEKIELSERTSCLGILNETCCPKDSVSAACWHNDCTWAATLLLSISPVGNFTSSVKPAPSFSLSSWIDPKVCENQDLIFCEIVCELWSPKPRAIFVNNEAQKQDLFFVNNEAQNQDLFFCEQWSLKWDLKISKFEMLTTRIYQ